MSQLSFFATDCEVHNLGEKTALRFRTVLPTRENPNLPVSSNNMKTTVDNDVSVVLEKEMALEISRLIHEYVV